MLPFDGGGEASMGKQLIYTRPGSLVQSTATFTALLRIDVGGKLLQVLSINLFDWILLSPFRYEPRDKAWRNLGAGYI